MTQNSPLTPPTDAFVTPSPLDAELRRRMIAANPPEPEIYIDEFTGKKECHRFMIPAPVGEQDPLTGKMVVKPYIAHVKCLGAKCSLWNSRQKECYDVTGLKAHYKTAQTIELIDGLLRMIQEDK